jgi:hypothetical protein
LQFLWKTHESCGSDDPIGEETTMQKAPAVRCLFLHIGGVLLTDGWDHQARKRAAIEFNLDLAELEGSTSPDLRYLRKGKAEAGRIFRPGGLPPRATFTRARFRRFMFAQSQPYPERIELIARPKVRHGLKIALVSNEARELNAHRSRKFKPDAVVDFYFLLFCPRPQTRREHLSACAEHRPGVSPADRLYRKYPQFVRVAEV